MSDQLVRVEQADAAVVQGGRAPEGGAHNEEVGVRDFLAFIVGDEQYALPLSAVREIMKPPAVTEVPSAPRNVLGIISVRGRVTTLIDLRRKLKMPEQALTVKTRVILVDKGEEVLGLLVDSVLQVYRLREDEVEMASIMGSDLAEYVMGIGRPIRHYSEHAHHAGAAVENAPAEDQSVDAGDRSGRAEMLVLLDPVALLKG
jgi:purine-binding chemotaxis protein CheW